MLFLHRSRPISAQWTESALECDVPTLTVPYSTMENIVPVGRSLNPERLGRFQFDIDVHHATGCLTIPARANQCSSEIYRYLLQRVTPSGSRDVNIGHADSLKQQIGLYGDRRVWSYCATTYDTRDHLHQSTASRTMLLCGLGWGVFAATVSGGEDYGILAGLLCFLGLVFEGWYQFTRENRAATRRNSSIIASIAGVSLVQGAFTGMQTRELRWQEIGNNPPSARTEVGVAHRLSYKQKEGCPHP